MTPRELAAYRAGLRQATARFCVNLTRSLRVRQRDPLSDLSIELRDDAREIRQRAAIEALRGLAEGLKVEARPEIPADRSVAIMAAIAVDPETAGTTACPECSGRLAWIKDAGNSHIHARCEHAGCFVIMQ